MKHCQANEYIEDLLAILKGYPDSENNDWQSRLFKSDFKRLLECSRFHGVSAVLYIDAKKNHLLKVFPDVYSKELHEEHLKLALKSIYLYEQLDSILSLFVEQGIPVILLKGAHLAREAYDNLGMRSMGDVDLLVRKEDLEKVEALLLSLGYAPDDKHRVVCDRNHHFAYRKKANISIEVHWTLHWSCLKGMDIEALWSRACLSQYFKQGVFVLSPEDLLLHLCLHSALHVQNIRLRMIYDLKVVLEKLGPNIDFEVLRQRAKEWKVDGSVYVFLRLAKELLGAELKDDKLTGIKPEGFNEEYFFALKAKLLVFDLEKSYAVMGSPSMLLWSDKAWSFKWKLLMEYLFVSPEAISLKLPVSANSWKVYLYYPVYWMEMVRKTYKLYRQTHRSKGKELEDLKNINNLTLFRHWMLSGSSEDAHEE